MKLDAGFEQACLIAVQLIRHHLPESDIQQTGLVHMLVRRRQHRDPRLAGPDLAGQPSREIVAQNGPTRATTDDQDSHCILLSK